MFRSIGSTPSCAGLSRVSTSLPRGKTWMAVTSTAMTRRVRQFERNLLQYRVSEVLIIRDEEHRLELQGNPHPEERALSRTRLEGWPRVRAWGPSFETHRLRDAPQDEGFESRRIKVSIYDDLFHGIARPGLSAGPRCSWSFCASQNGCKGAKGGNGGAFGFGSPWCCPLRADDDETSESLKFRLGGEGQSSW